MTQLAQKPQTAPVREPVQAPAVVSTPSYALSASLVTLSEPGSEQAESIRALRTRLMSQHFEMGRRALAVCAATPDVNCTFVASNLAVSLAQIGLNTLLIDADLRRPGVDSFIQPPPPVTGLIQKLSSPDDHVGQFIHHNVIPNLSVLFAGGVAVNAQELLSNASFNDLMEQCLRDYDATIVDTPPASVCADVQRVGAIVGYSLIVAKQNVSRVGDLRTLISQLESDGVSVVGTVLSEA